MRLLYQCQGSAPTTEAERRGFNLMIIGRCEDVIYILIKLIQMKCDKLLDIRKV